MLSAILPRTRHLIPQSGLFEGSLAAFWEERFLPQWLPLLLGLLLGPVAAIFVADDQWLLVVPLVLFIPVGILFIRYPFVAIVLWILIFPFFSRDPSPAGTITYWMLHRAAIPAALCVVVLADWLGLRKQRRVRYGAAELVMLLFLIVGLFNMLVLHETGSRSLIRFYDVLVVPFCMYWLIRLLAPNEKDLTRLASVGIVAMLAQLAVALLSWYAPQSLPSFWIADGGERTAGTFGSPGVYGATLVFLSLLLAQAAIVSRPGVFRVVSLLIVVLGFLGVFFSFSRGSWLAGLLVVAGLIVIYPRLIIGFTLGIPLLVVVLSSGALAGEMNWAERRLNDGYTAENRIIVSAASLEMIQAKPVLGWGFGNHDLFVDRFKMRVGNIPLQAGGRLGSHNTYFTIMAELGLAGFLLYAFPTIWWLAASVKVRNRLPRSGFRGRSWLWMLWLALLAQVTVSSFADLFTSGEFATVLWWMTMGLIATVVWPSLEDGRQGERLLPTIAPVVASGDIVVASGLAYAEREAIDRGLVFAWVPDESADLSDQSARCDAERPGEIQSHEVLGCIVYPDLRTATELDRSHQLASVWGIAHPDAACMRVVEAELAALALSEMRRREELSATAAERASASLLKHLASVPDSRSPRGRRHPLPAILALTTAAILAGAGSQHAIAQWGRLRSSEEVRAFGFTQDRTPASSTLHRVFKELDVGALEGALAAWAREEPGDTGEAIAIDRKALQDTLDEGFPAVQRLVVVYCGKIGLFLVREAHEKPYALSTGFDDLRDSHVPS